MLLAYYCTCGKNKDNNYYTCYYTKLHWTVYRAANWQLPIMIFGKQNDLAASRKLIHALGVPTTFAASVKFWCTFIYHRQLAGVFNWKRWKIPRSRADIGYTSYRLHQSGTNGGSEEMASCRLLLFYSGKRAWAHSRRPRKGFCCCCWMLIGEAFRGCIHPHADAIYRSAADVLVSSIIRRRNQQAPQYDGDAAARGHGVRGCRKVAVVFSLVQTPQRRDTRPLGACWGGCESFEDGLARIRRRTRPDPTPADWFVTGLGHGGALS